MKNKTLKIIIASLSLILVSLIFLLSETYNFTSFTNISDNNYEIETDSITDDDSCSYYLNRSVEFIYDTLASMETYKNDKELELNLIKQKNIELQNKVSNNVYWKSKFYEVEKENLKLISNEYDYKIEYDNRIKYKEIDKGTGFVGVLETEDSIIYNDKNKTYISSKKPFGINYYKDGKLIDPDIDARVYFGETYDFNIKQEMTAETIITEKDNKLSVEIIPDIPDVKVHSKETFFEIDKKRIKQLIKNIDPNNYILDIK